MEKYCHLAFLVILLINYFLPCQGASGHFDCVPRRNEFLGKRKCGRKCESDINCDSPKKECQCDGLCGKSCVNPNQRCYPVPTAIPNGRVVIRPYNKFGAIAKYSCDDGYSLVGLPARVCQGDGTWMGEPPHCQFRQDIDPSIKCGQAPRVHHARHDGPYLTSYDLATDLKYSCDPGFTMNPDSVDKAWCVGGGVWVGPNMTCAASGCPTPRDIPHGYVEMPHQNTVGSKLRYRCLEEYFLIGNPERTCQRDGSWDGKEPSCEQAKCGPAPVIEHAEHDGPKDQQVFAAGILLRYTCKFGYYREGSPRAFCSGNQGWVGPVNMTCKARDCGPPGDITNGRREPGYRFTYPTRVTYSCNDGYELRGKHYRECQANGEWDGQLPKCEPVHCSELRPPVHGTMIGTDTSFNSVISFVCYDGFRVVGSKERTCQADRTWSGEDTSCEEINCGSPGPLWNGYLDGHRTTIGAIYFYRCNLRTKLNGVNFQTQCLENGQWSHPPPLCLGQCQVPYIANGTVLNARESTWVDHETQIIVECLNGLVLNDSRVPVCQNGTWNMVPQCMPAPCSQSPPQIEQGHRVFFSVSHGSKARYFCMVGYKLKDSSHRYLTCLFGKWEGTAPSCVPNYCENPGRLEHGTIYSVGHLNHHFRFEDYMVTIKHGDRIAYRCDRNYKMIGPRGAACINGHWRPWPKPECRASKHPSFQKLWKPVEEAGRGSFFY